MRSAKLSIIFSSLVLQGEWILARQRFGQHAELLLMCALQSVKCSRIPENDTEVGSTIGIVDFANNDHIHSGRFLHQLPS